MILEFAEGLLRWAILLIAPFVLLIVMSVFSASLRHEPPVYATWAVLTAISLAPGLMVIARSRAHRAFKLWCAVLYVIVYVPVIAMGVYLVNCHWLPCEI